MKNFLSIFLIAASLFLVSCDIEEYREPLPTCPQGEVDPGNPSEGCYIPE